MCGIAGYIGERYIEDDIAIETEKIMQSRGPDNSGKIRHRFSGKNIILLHSHLSIIGDLNSARQPITSKKQILVYNGEIYNYLELASQYRSLISSQNSDTQVLASLLENLPIEIVLPLLDGMWSFAFFDRIEDFYGSETDKK